MIKKITALAVMAVLCLQITASAQKKAITKTYQIGDKVPDIQLNGILNHSTTQTKLSDFKNKAILLDFWATWCGPWMSEMPNVAAAYDK